MDSQNTSSNQNQKVLKQIEDFFDTYLHKKIPFQLPANVKEILAKFGPWVILITMVLAIPAVLTAIGLGAFFAPFAMVYGRGGYGGGFYLGGLIQLIAFVMTIIALPGLFARSVKGWHMLYYAALVSFIGRIFLGDILGAIIGLALGIYVLFQVKELYK